MIIKQGTPHKPPAAPLAEQICMPGGESGSINDKKNYTDFVSWESE